MTISCHFCDKTGGVHAHLFDAAASSRKRWPVARFVVPLSCIVAMVAVMATLSYAFPDAVGRHFMEDHTFELLTAATFLWAALIVAVAVGRRQPVSPLAKVAGLLAFLAFLDEMSFGERQFNLEAPIIWGTKIDALHDFLLLLWGGIEDGSPASMILAAIGILAGAAAVTLAVRRGWFDMDPDWPLLGFAGAFGICGLACDVMLEEPGRVILERSRLEEQLEFSAAILTLLFARRSLRQHLRRMKGVT